MTTFWVNFLFWLENYRRTIFYEQTEIVRNFARFDECYLLVNQYHFFPVSPTVFITHASQNCLTPFTLIVYHKCCQHLYAYLD